MKILAFKQEANRILSILIVFLILGTSFDAHRAFADDESSKLGQGKENKKIHITADSLISDGNDNYLEFIGNVKAIQGNTVITADSLKIFYKNGPDRKGSPTPVAESINKIVASGNVTIKFDEKIAVAQRAVYIMETEVLVLTGANSRITSGNNFIAGEKITLHRAEDRITVEGNDTKRVEAVFYSSDKNVK